MQESEWLRARKKLLQQVRAQVRILSGPLTPDLRQYLKEYKSEFKPKWNPSTQEEFQQQLSKSTILLGGDFHAFSQSQRLHLRILRKLQRPFVLCIECVESKYQKYVDLFLAGEITEQEFLTRVKWNKHWGFPWENYKPLFDLAVKQKFKIFALNRYELHRTHQSLGRRDAHAAEKIKAIHKKYPEHLKYVIFGDLHLAKSHLPQALINSFGYDPEPLLLFQNPEELYFRMAKRGLENEVEWLSRTTRRFCNLSSPPWIKWQSYLIFLEHNFDKGLLELEEDEAEGIDLTDQVGSLVRFLSRDLKLQMSVDDLAVYSPGQLSFDGLFRQQLSFGQKRIAQKLIQEDRSFYIPELGLLYLSRLSINHAAALAGRYIHYQLSGSKRLFWEQPRDFTASIWQEAIGFFFSKLINHRRKSENLRSLKARMAVVDVKDLAKEALKIALDQRMLEIIFVHTGRLRSLKVKSRNPWVYLEAARITGEMMGERLYEAFRARRFTRSQLIKWLKEDLDSDDFQAMYLALVKRLESVKLHSLDGEAKKENKKENKKEGVSSW